MDQDEGINDNILYEISGGNAMINGTPSFSINETTGLISVNVPMLDREEHGMYSLFVIVSGYAFYSPSVWCTPTAIVLFFYRVGKVWNKASQHQPQ